MEIKLDSDSKQILTNIFSVMDANHKVLHDTLQTLKEILKQIQTQTKMSEEFFGDINELRGFKSDSN